MIPKAGCIDCGYRDTRCVSCNSKLIDQANNRREWDHYHPGEPIPECELNKVR
jgi:hypothetical protein